MLPENSHTSRFRQTRMFVAGGITRCDNMIQKTGGKRLPKSRKKKEQTRILVVSWRGHGGSFTRHTLLSRTSLTIKKIQWKSAKACENLLCVSLLAGFKIRPWNPWAQLAFISELRVGCDITRILTHIELSQPCVSGIMKLRNTHLHNERVLIMHHDSSR